MKKILSCIGGIMLLGGCCAEECEAQTCTPVSGMGLSAGIGGFSSNDLCGDGGDPLENDDERFLLGDTFQPEFLICFADDICDIRVRCTYTYPDLSTDVHFITATPCLFSNNGPYIVENVFGTTAMPEIEFNSFGVYSITTEVFLFSPDGTTLPYVDEPGWATDIDPFTDWDDDNDIDINDLLGFLSDYYAGFTQADVNFDQTVDVLDLLFFQQQYFCLEVDY